MVAVAKRKRGENDYYYLYHDVIKNGKKQQHEKYLGQEIPPDLAERKKQFLDEIYREEWFPQIDWIKQNFSKEQTVMPDSAREKEFQNFVIQFTYDTQRIEGSTLTHRETADLLEKGITPATKPIRDVKETEAHSKLFQELVKTKEEMTHHSLMYWHERLFKETKPDVAGKPRTWDVRISGSKFIPPAHTDVRPLLTGFFEWYDANKQKLHPVELAALVHLKLVTIHPFGDGNGRITRLVMNLVLNLAGYPMLVIPYGGRTRYYKALERAQVQKDDRIFVHWFIKKYIKEYKKYVK